MNIVKTFHKPYPLDTNLKRQLISAFAFGLFVFAFLFFFRPFGLSELESGLLFSTLGFGLITFFINGSLQWVAPKLLGKHYREESWTLGKNLLWVAIIITCVAFGNFLWAHQMGFTGMTVAGLVKFFIYTLAIGIFPVGFVMMIEQNRLTKKYLKESESINQQIKGRSTISQAEADSDVTSLIKFKSEGGIEEITIDIEDFLYCKSADNYIEVFFVKGEEVTSKLIRNSLKNLENDFSTQESLKRVHRSYLVNLKKVVDVSGNARGLKLCLGQNLAGVPISRSKHDEILAHLNS